MVDFEELDHEALFEEAWVGAGHTAVELPAVDVNRVLRERYEVRPAVEFTATSLWDMEARKAAAPDKYLPNVVKPGSVEWFPGARRGAFQYFTRVSEQRLWLDPTTFGVVIEHGRLDHAARRAFFLGVERFRATDGREFVAGTGQPLFHVEHSVAGTQEEPLNLWRIVHLTERPDPAMAAFFAEMGRERYLREFNEVYLREDLNRSLERRSVLV